MKKHFIYVRTQESGCDYTIGCGISLEDIYADSKEDAIKQIIALSDSWKEDLREWIKQEDGDIDGCYHDTMVDTGLTDVMDDPYVTKPNNLYVLEIADSFSMIGILKLKLRAAEDFKAELLKEAKESSEKEQYEKLKKKFEKK